MSSRQTDVKNYAVQFVLRKSGEFKKKSRQKEKSKTGTTRKHMYAGEAPGVATADIKNYAHPLIKF